MPTNGGGVNGVVLGRPIDEINDMGFVPRNNRGSFSGIHDSEQRRRVAQEIRKREKKSLSPVETQTAQGDIRVDANLSVPLGPVNQKNVNLRLWRARMMQKTHYGMVTVRTDGTHILCAMMDETAEDWITHLFEARF